MAVKEPFTSLSEHVARRPEPSEEARDHDRKREKPGNKVIESFPKRDAGLALPRRILMTETGVSQPSEHHFQGGKGRSEYREVGFLG